MSDVVPPEWEAWDRGEGRCPYCIGESWPDFVTMCDCWQVDREREPLRYRVLRWIREAQ